MLLRGKRLRKNLKNFFKIVYLPGKIQVSRTIPARKGLLLPCKFIFRIDI